MMANPYSTYAEKGRGRTSGRMSEADFRRMVDDVRQRHSISDVVSKWTKLRPVKREFVGLCLRHKERTPSMRVSDVKGVVWCFACGYTRDIFGVLQDMTGCSFMEALRVVADGDLPVVDPAERVRQREEDEADRRRDLADVHLFWESSIDPAGTPAEVYLRSRGITMASPPSVRFGMVPAWRDRESGEWGTPLPAMVCAIYDRAAGIVGIQRIFLRDGGRQKARMKRPKLTLGSIRGASLRLGPVQPTIIVCEGPEDGLSIAQELPECSVWPTLGTGLMPVVEYPPEVREVVIAGQNDDAGKDAVARAAEQLALRGYSVRTMFPDPAFKDWNDQLRGVRK